MAAPTHNFTWEQGEDGLVSIQYREGPVGGTVTVDLTGYSLRMDMRSVSITGDRVWTFNSDDIPEAGVDTVGPDDNEATLGSDGSIRVVVPRAISLPGGPIFEKITTNITTFHYDIFLRDGVNLQKKILQGTINYNRSATHWS